MGCSLILTEIKLFFEYIVILVLQCHIFVVQLFLVNEIFRGADIMDEAIKNLKLQNVNKLAIMGGTFDPIHYGHLVSAESVRMQYNIDKVMFIPSGDPPHKVNVNVTPAEHRYIMVQIAALTNPHFEVSRLELDRGGRSYTIDTIKELRDILGDSIELFFITGADALLEILTWKSVGELLALCRFIAVTRPGYGKSELDNKVAELKSLFKSDIITINVPEFAISSTDIRGRIESGRSIKYLVPESVEEYIGKNKLYGYRR